MPRVVAGLLIGFVGGMPPLALAAYMSGQGFDAALFAIMIAWTIPWLVLVTRGLRIRFDADTEGVTVANLWRSHRIAWSDIASLHTGPAPFWWQTKQHNMVLQVECVDGRVVSAIGTIRPSRDFEQLVSDIDPTAELALAHGIATTAYPLDASEVLRIDRQVAMVNVAASVVRALND